MHPARALKTLKSHSLILASSTLMLFGTQAISADLQKVTFAYPTNISLSNAPTLMAIGMGYFEEAGLDVEINFFQGAAMMLPQVAQKHIDFGWTPPDPLVISLSPDRDRLPVKMFYNGIYQSPYEIVVLEDSDIHAIKDLKDKKIGVGAMSWGNLLITETMLRDYEYALQKDYEFVPVGVGATALRALTDGSIDALNLFDTFHVQMENTGTKLRRVPFEQRYRELFSSGWMAHEDTLTERPDLVKKFARAASKGVVACNADPKACVMNFWNLYPTTRPTQGTEEEQLNDAVRVLSVRLATMLPDDGPSKMGYYKLENWQDYARIMHIGGQLKIADAPVERLFTNEFVADINDFDADKIIEEVKVRQTQ